MFTSRCEVIWASQRPDHLTLILSLGKGPEKTCLQVDCHCIQHVPFWEGPISPGPDRAGPSRTEPDRAGPSQIGPKYIIFSQNID